MTDASADLCPVCGGALRRYRRDWLRRCEGCQTLRSDFDVRIPASAGEAPLDEGLRETGLEVLRQANNARLLAAVVRHRPPPASLLDVGSGPGFLLSAAAQEGYSSLGVEPDANVVEAARGRGAPVRHGYFPDRLEPGEQFDVIVFNDVLEHIPDLAMALDACLEHLKPGGVLCLNCPDRRGLFFRTAALLDRLGASDAYDRLWQRGLPSPHLWYFTPANLHQAVSHRGLAPLEDVRLETVDLRGLWERIRCVRDQPLAVSIAAYLFTVATYPLARLTPSDAVACLFRKPAN